MTHSKGRGRVNGLATFIRIGDLPHRPFGLGCPQCEDHLGVEALVHVLHGGEILKLDQA